MKSVGWTLFLLTVAEIIYFNLAKIVILTLLGAAAIFLLICIILAFEGTAQGIKKRKLERERLPEAATARLIAQAGALATIGTERGQTVADEELKRLRRMAGLDTAD